MNQRKELSDEDTRRLLAARADHETHQADYRRLVLELGTSVGVNAVCRTVGISTSVYYDWKAKAAED